MQNLPCMLHRMQTTISQFEVEPGMDSEAAAKELKMLALQIYKSACFHGLPALEE